MNREPETTIKMRLVCESREKLKCRGPSPMRGRGRRTHESVKGHVPEEPHEGVMERTPAWSGRAADGPAGGGGPRPMSAPWGQFSYFLFF